MHGNRSGRNRHTSDARRQRLVSQSQKASRRYRQLLMAMLISVRSLVGRQLSNTWWFFTEDSDIGTIAYDIENGQLVKIQRIDPEIRNHAERLYENKYGVAAPSQ